MIRAMNPMKMLVLNLKSLLIPGIFIILFITAHFVIKTNINDVLAKKFG
jgi:hypothetical protein